MFTELESVLVQLESEQLDAVLTHARRLLAQQEIVNHGIPSEVWTRLPWWLRVKIFFTMWVHVTWSRLRSWGKGL